MVVRKFRRRHFNFGFSRYLNSCSTKTTGFISSVRVGIENILVIESFSMGELPICVPCISALTVRKFQKVLLLCTAINFRTCSPQPLHFRIPPSRTQSKTYHLLRSYEVENRSFFRCIRIAISLNFQKNLLLISFLDIQSHPHLSPITTGFISSISVSIKKFSVLLIFSMEQLSILFLALEH